MLLLPWVIVSLVAVSSLLILILVPVAIQLCLVVALAFALCACVESLVGHGPNANQRFWREAVERKVVH